jgi:hypothetical protein
MQKGDRVKVHGLVNAAQHNGNYGVVTSKRLKEGRVVVKLDDGTEINVKPGNLQLILMDLGEKELKVGTKVVTVAFVEPYPPDLSLIGYVKDFSQDRTMVKCMFTENSPDERPFFVANIQNLRVAPGEDEEIPLSFAIDIARPGIMTQRRVDIEDHRIKDLSGIESLTSAVSINLSGNEIASLDNVVFPPRLELLNLSFNNVVSLKEAVFPDSLRHLNLSDNKITSLVGVVFPAGLEELFLDDNPIAFASIEVVLPRYLSRLRLSTRCKVSSGFLSKYDKTEVSGSAGSILLYKLKPMWSAMQQSFSHGREPLHEAWEYSGDPSSRSDLIAAQEAAQAAYTAEKTKASVLQQASPSMAEFLHPDTLERENKEFLAELYGEEDTPLGKKTEKTPTSMAAAAAGPRHQPPPRPPASLPSEADARSKTFLEGTKYSYNDKYKTLSRPRDDGEHGGSKTRRRQGRRQSKRNKMQRKNKYSRRRRNAKSRSK